MDEEIKKLNDSDQGFSPLFAELKRRFGWEFNCMRLHEYYFENISKESKCLLPDSGLVALIKEQFGSYDSWICDFKATGSMRGIGWVILAHDTWTGRLMNTWVNEHDMGHLAGTKPLLVMDVFEHAFMLDYGLKRADYITAFFNAIDWDTVQKRFTTNY